MTRANKKPAHADGGSETRAFGRPSAGWLSMAHRHGESLRWRIEAVKSERARLESLGLGRSLRFEFTLFFDGLAECDAFCFVAEERFVDEGAHHPAS